VKRNRFSRFVRSVNGIRDSMRRERVKSDGSIARRQPALSGELCRTRGARISSHHFNVVIGG